MMLIQIDSWCREVRKSSSACPRIPDACDRQTLDRVRVKVGKLCKLKNVLKSWQPK